MKNELLVLAGFLQKDAKIMPVCRRHGSSAKGMDKTYLGLFPNSR
jgi:hypothetical protein